MADRRRLGMRAGRALVEEPDDWDDDVGGQAMGAGMFEENARRGFGFGRDRDDRAGQENRRFRGGGGGGGGGFDRRGDRNNRGGRGGGFGRDRGGGRGGGGGRGTRPLTLSPDFLQNLMEKDSAGIVLTLANPNTKFREGLKRCEQEANMLRLMLQVLAKAFTCNSTPEQLNIVSLIIRECNFFNLTMSYFLDMQAENDPRIQRTFKQPIKDMIVIMEELAVKNPAEITQFVGVHGVIKAVINSLADTDVIDDELLKDFREFTERIEKTLTRKTRRRTADDQDRQREQDLNEPPDDFRDIEIFPQTADMHANGDRYLRSNKVKGRYNDLEHYLDVQFRLLREDFVEPLRSGVSEYIQVTQDRVNKRQKNQNVRIYNNVRLISSDCGDNGLLHVLQFDVSGLGHVRWNSTKRLIYGSLLCLSSDNFATFYFATVMNRESNQLVKGLVNVHFEHDHQTVRGLFGQSFTMAETTAYFESYRHVLKGLQRVRQGDLPFERYIIQCENQVQAPAYIQRNPTTTLDLRPLVDEESTIMDDRRLGENIGVVEEAVGNWQFSDHSEPARKVAVLERSTWPPSDLLHLDESQYKAIHTALTKEFVITQGPPGTGKTYIGLKIVKALLHNKDIWSKNPDTGARDLRPMLIVCYTNHALDQFLEGIVKFYKGDVLRVGGRSQSEVLKQFNLNNFRQRFRHAQKIPVAVFQGRREAKNEMDSLMSKISEVSAKIQVATTNILREDFLQPFIGPTHYRLLTHQFEMMLGEYQDVGQFIDRNHSILVEWLELGNLAPIVEMEGNQAPDIGAQAMPPEAGPEEELIDVENEIDAIQADRMIEVDEEDESIDTESELDDDLFDMLLNADSELTRKQRNDIRVRLAIREQQQAVALNVEQMVDRPGNIFQAEWQTQRKQKKKMKQKVQKNLTSTDRMTEQEADRITDIWRMSLKNKWRLYRLWVQKYCDYLRLEIAEKEEEYDAAAERYREALMQEDKEIMRHSTVLGMTTTGAARYQAILQEIGPRIIVVEEAAEVLEAHIVTTLSRGCEHLILIGDHKQLKPNPTVYKLATKYGLDVSLFERMVENGIKCDCLELQHRMRPEIAELMHHIYDTYKNHDDVKTYERIKGMANNIFFINHNNAETYEEDLRSNSNKHEAEYIVALCKYLLLQGYKPEQITVLTLYSGQLFCLRGLMPKEVFDGVKATVVDSYQGEENDIILLSLVRSNSDGDIGFLKIENRVCVALSRAKKGFYAIGNFELLRDKSNLWERIVSHMIKAGRFGEGLVLYCQNHPDEDGIVAKDPIDFQKAPEGGCNKSCNFRLDCGHVCERFCHVTDQNHKDYDCRKKCQRLLCDAGHRCKKFCNQVCGPCQEKAEKVIPKCGHTQLVPCFQDPDEFECMEECNDTLPCGHKCQSRCGKAHTKRCTSFIDKTWPCGHKGQIPCHQRDDALCPQPCNAILGCEHQCTGTCGKCFQGRLHRPCQQNCRRILVCGHDCSDKCNQCPPCTKKCENRCPHSICRKQCGEPCAPCMELCQWQCEHYQCWQLCSEPCDRPRCDQPCRKTLVCGHQCIGLCGEPCPTDCKVCDKEKVTELFFGNEDEPYARFVLLEDCRAKCIVESDAMDNYMDQQDEQGEIKLKVCPKCKTPIRKTNRYRKIINRTLKDIEAVKKTVLAKKDRIVNLEKDIREQIDTEADFEIKQQIKRRLNAMKEPKSENTLAALSNQLSLVGQISKLENDWREHIHGIAFQNDMKESLIFLKHFKDWVLEERSIMTPQEIKDGELELARSKAYFKLLLFQRRAKDSGTNLDIALKTKIVEAERIIKSQGKYEESKMKIVEDCFEQLKKVIPLSSLGITEKERAMIVSAMSLPSGHWFKCPRGHIYAIGDCGGANEVGRCPECNSEIGGMNYQLRAGNRLAQEMDGAQAAAWSDAGNVGEHNPFDIRFED